MLQTSPLIVVEGPDGSGKTSLINAWRKAGLYFAILRNSNPTPDLPAIFRTVQFVRNRPRGMPLVLDRYAPLSERVYGPVLRGVNMLQDFSVAWGLIDVDLTSVVYCCPSTAQLQYNTVQSDHLDGVRDRITWLATGYDELMRAVAQRTSIRVVNHDWSEDPLTIWERACSPSSSSV